MLSTRAKRESLRAERVNTGLACLARGCAPRPKKENFRLQIVGAILQDKLSHF